ncbi:vWA domain-containing protein [Edaphobacter flagellatus]|uniref:hypothetical protein n=1 Tax=Edaphobacter flagellatus TaxID=1933044 RepID=UPI0021B23453|nr:hypothetical protein [Edaphobacter flagellatus]
MKLHAALTFALAAASSLAYTQEPAPQTPTISTQSTLVLVPALVRDKSGNLVYTLSADNFTLTDDGIPQKLHLEEDTGGEPLALVVVIEIGGAGAREFNKFCLHRPAARSDARIHRRQRSAQSRCRCL